MGIKKFDEWVNESIRDKMTAKMSKEEAFDTIIPLESVGSGIDEKGNVYIMLADGGYDLHPDVIDHINGHLSTEWWYNLNAKDRETVRQIRELIKKK